MTTTRAAIEQALAAIDSATGLVATAEAQDEAADICLTHMPQLLADHDVEKKALEDELVRVRAEMRRFMPLLERVAEGPFWDELTAGLGIGTINAYRAALSPTTTNG